MGRVIVDVSPSIDGYIAGRGVTIEKAFGDAGLRLHVMPVLLGSGIPLFDRSSPRYELEATSAIPAPNATHVNLRGRALTR